MTKIYPDTFYASIYEDFRQKNGENSLYYNLMFNPTKISLMNGSRSTSKSELKKVLDEKMSNIINLNQFIVKETDYGWVYERYVKILDEESLEYEVVKEGEHTDHEVFTVDISFHEEVYGIFKELL